MSHQPSLREVEVTNATIATWQWKGDGPPVFLVHATGFHGRCWDRVVEALPGRRVIAVDVRGHGRSSCPPPPYLWPDLASDLAEVIERLDLTNIIGAGHSMGGHLLARLADAQPARFGRLLLLDPTIVAPEVLEAIATRPEKIFPPVAKRRSRFASAEEMTARLRERENFSRWDPRVLDDYCRYGLRPAADGDGFELACPPVVEAAVYVGQTDPEIYRLVTRVHHPVRIVRARPYPAGVEVRDFSYSPTWPELVRLLPNATETVLADATHFFPMEQPGFVAAQIAALTAERQ